MKLAGIAFVACCAVLVVLSAGAGTAEANFKGQEALIASDSWRGSGVNANGDAIVRLREGLACRAGAVSAVVGGARVCLRVGAKCKARYQAAYRKHGFHCVNGRLRKGTGIPATPPNPTPAPPPPPPPAPTPHAQPGHYKGLTSQITNFEFDVTSDGNFVTNLVTGQINEGCTPEGSLYGGDLNFGTAMIPIAADGSFTIDGPYNGTVGEDPSTGHLTIVGHLSGSTATGTLSDTVSFTHDGTQYSCGSGLQTWTAPRTG